jgi:hypothetical protein
MGAFCPQGFKANLGLELANTFGVNLAVETSFVFSQFHI